MCLTLVKYFAKFSAIMRKKEIDQLIVHLTKPHGQSNFLVHSKDESGKPTRRYFRTYTEAFKHVEATLLTKEAYGTQVAISPPDMVDADWALKELKPYGLTIRDAVRDSIAYRERIKKTVPFSDFAAEIEEWVPTQLAKKEYRWDTLKNIRAVVKRLKEYFGDKWVSEIRTKDILDWRDALRQKKDGSYFAPDGEHYSNKSLNTYVSTAHIVFQIAIQKEYARLSADGESRINPVHGVKELPVEPEDKRKFVLTYEQVRQILWVGVASDPEVMPFLIFRFQTGIRPTAIKGLKWEDIYLDRKYFKIHAVRAKKRKTYTRPFTPNALEWLKHYEQKEGSILALSEAPQNFGKPSEIGTHNRMLEVARKAGIVLPHNTARCTFISHHIGHSKYATLTAELVNTSRKMVEEEYQEPLENPDDAEKYLNIPYPTPAQIKELKRKIDLQEKQVEKEKAELRAKFPTLHAEDTVREWHRLHLKKWANVQIAKKYGVDVSTVQAALSGETYPHVYAEFHGNHRFGEPTRFLRQNNTSGYRWVHFDKSKNTFVAQIYFDHQYRHLGRFATAEEAAHAADKVALERFGPGTRLNFPAETYGYNGNGAHDHPA
jgi:integrase